MPACLDAVELGLFRVLQESLTNVHRHSASPSVDIRLNLDLDHVILEVRDYGCGIPQELVRRFQEDGYGSALDWRVCGNALVNLAVIWQFRVRTPYCGDCFDAYLKMRG